MYLMNTLKSLNSLLFTVKISLVNSLTLNRKNKRKNRRKKNPGLPPYLSWVEVDDVGEEQDPRDEEGGHHEDPRHQVHPRPLQPNGAKEGSRQTKNNQHYILYCSPQGIISIQVFSQRLVQSRNYNFLTVGHSGVALYSGRAI